MKDDMVSKIPAKERGQKPLSIKRSDEKQVFFKPVKSGEKLEGKLVGITDGGFGKVLKLKTKKGVVGVNVGEFLSDIDFADYAEQVLRFTYKGTVGKRGMRIFDVDVILGKDEVPF